MPHGGHHCFKYKRQLVIGHFSLIPYNSIAIVTNKADSLGYWRSNILERWTPLICSL